jgi:primosomal protein N' (replication factor Y)
VFAENDIVCVLIPNVANSGYDYRLPAAAATGQFVRVSVMNRPYIGVIIGPGASELPPEKIKPVLDVFNGQMDKWTDGQGSDKMSICPSVHLPFPGLSDHDIRWIMKMSEWTMMNPGAVLRLVINVPDAFDPPKAEPLYAYSPSEKTRMTEQRQLVADAFASNDNDPMPSSDICAIAGVSPAVVRTMIKNEILKESGERRAESAITTANYYDTGAVVLNDEQRAAADAIKQSGFGVHLLDGITGSGKTQVYFDAALRAYSAGKSVLLMMPEIALTAQFKQRFTDRFGAPPVVWHSNLTAAKRRDIWRGVAAGHIRIVVGTRSALFLPWQDLGLIVVDEEHDGSYKQEDMGNYHARDMAILRAKIADFPVVLASATPSLETLHNVELGKYAASRLTSRFGGATMPTIETIDMRQKEQKEEGKGQDSLSLTLQNAISETLAARQQVMLFINRRGYARIVQCKKCGWVAQCPDCSCGMNLHKSAGKLLCHICGRTMPAPAVCPECGAAELSVSGIGVEKLNEEVATKFPDAKTAIVSSDTMQSRQAMERLVARMESGDIDLVIGTQILAKGHHFPNLTLVGVIDADMGLFGADFRSFEKTFQQLFQVAGRAGRGANPGRVLLQTYQPEHPVLRAICNCDRDGLMALDMDGRRLAKMPPFGQLIAVIVEAESEKVLQEFCAKLAGCAPQINGGKILGPIPAQIYQIRNWYRMRFLVSGDQRAALQPAVAHWLKKVKAPANVRIKIDVAPQNFM